MPAKLALDPEPLDPQEAITCVAGDTIPEASVSILNGHIARITRAQISGDKQALIVTQRLWRIRGQLFRTALAGHFVMACSV